MVLTLANLEGEETFDSSLLGQADEVVQERVCDDELILVKGYVGGATPEGAGRRWGSYVTVVLFAIKRSPPFQLSFGVGK